MVVPRLVPSLSSKLVLPRPSDLSRVAHSGIGYWSTFESVQLDSMVRNPHNSLSDERYRTIKIIRPSTTQELVDKNELCGPSADICAKLVTMRGGRKEGNSYFSVLRQDDTYSLQL